MKKMTFFNIFMDCVFAQFKFYYYFCKEFQNNIFKQ